MFGVFLYCSLFVCFSCRLLRVRCNLGTVPRNLQSKLDGTRSNEDLDLALFSAMPGWMTVTLRCWIAFVAFTNFGASFRCFTDYNFVHSKFFGIENYKTIAYVMKDGPFLERMYGFWSLINGIVLLCCFQFIGDKKIIGLSICVIGLHLIFISLEGFLYKTVVIHGPTIYPFVISAVTLSWLVCCLLYPSRTEDCMFDENEILRKQFPFKSMLKKTR